MTATAVPPANPTSASATSIPLEDAQIEASTLLTRLHVRWDQLAELRDSRQGRLFVPRSTREAIGRQYLADRLAQAAARAAGYPSSLGNTHAPGNTAAWTLLAQIEVDLVDVRRRVLDAHARQGTCAIPRHVYARPTRTTLLPFTRDLVFSIPTVGLMRHVNRILAHLLEQADRVVDGDDRTELGGECPHCGNPSLVVYLEEGRVSCEQPRDPRGSHRLPCRCSNPLCDCRRDPVAHVHSWYRDRRAGDADSWQALAGRLDLTHLARKKGRP